MEVNMALTAPVKSKLHSTPKDVFSYLLMFAVLYATVVSYLTVLFQYVDFKFPDQLNYGRSGILDAIRFASSFLIVVWPVFLLMSWLISRDIQKNPEKRDIGIRKWLVYLTLFVSAITLIGDTIGIVYNFYSGSLSTSFVLKVLAILLVGATVFGYYLWNIHTLRAEKTKIPRTVGITISIVLVISIVGGFFIVGSPAQQRKIRFDEQRILDLQNIQSQVESFYASQTTLPMSLSELEGTGFGFIVPRDPETNNVYEYRRMGEKKYTLCALFTTALDVATSPTRGSASVSVPYGASTPNFSHQAERTCFDFTVNVALLPKKVPVTSGD
jgi:hypothetical protein